MKEQFLPYEQALKLKELGFNEECFACYNKDGELNKISEWHPDLRYLQEHPKICLAPLWQQAFDWLDREFGLFVSFDKIDNTRIFYYDFTVIDSKNRDYDDEYLIDFASRKLDKGKFKTYEEARLACLEKLIEIVESK